MVTTPDELVAPCMVLLPPVGQMCVCEWVNGTSVVQHLELPVDLRSAM